ncbi:MAG: nicotinate-nucleotide adenylyltransferase [Candidatus Omnitrophota bacterium]
MRIGLLGGTFDPIHIGHILLAQECWHGLGLDKVVFIPAFIPPHKKINEDISVADRLNLVRISLEGDKRFEISTYEIDAQGTSYSVDTVEHFIKTNRGADIFFITGSDSSVTLGDWKRIDDILALTTFVIVSRPGWKDESPYEERIMRMKMPHVDISSTEIRRRIKAKEPIDHFLMPAAVEYIRNKGLYL